ncbi:MAG: polysaccharide biosynthesis C-terminal domain-containing protein, partial [Clostridia bacterium]|nr:polysaccharide biosynthesis C-terminal domain-containing protein [Clostridia bacterium]
MALILSTENKVFFSQLKKLMLPIAFQNLVHSAVSAGDAAMLGFVSQDAMAAVSLTAQIQFVQNMFLSALVSGATLMTAQYWGKGDKATVGRIFALILRYAMFISAVFFLAAMFIPEKLIGFYTQEPELVRIGSEYIRIASFSYLITGISQCCLCVMKTTGNTKKSVAISSFSLGLDTVLNAVFIFGLFGCPALGARGAAITTVIAHTIELTLALVVTIRFGVHPKGLGRVIPWLEKDFWRYSFPLLLNCLTWGLGTTSYSAIIG